MNSPEPTATKSVYCQWIADFLSAHGITFEVGPPMAYDQHGREYTTLLLGGPRDEDNPEYLSMTASTEAVAKTQYEKVLMEFIGQNRHVVWRTEPDFDSMRLGEFVTKWSVYSRLNAYPERLG